MTTATKTPLWLEAQQELLRLQEQMADLEEHLERHHDREEFVTCDTCDHDFYEVRNRLERHIELWASTWAEKAADLFRLLQDIHEVAADQSARWEARLCQVREKARRIA